MATLKYLGMLAMAVASLTVLYRCFGVAQRAAGEALRAKWPLHRLAFVLRSVLMRCLFLEVAILLSVVGISMLTGDIVNRWIMVGAVAATVVMCVSELVWLEIKASQWAKLETAD